MLFRRHTSVQGAIPHARSRAPSREGSITAPSPPCQAYDKDAAHGAHRATMAMPRRPLGKTGLELSVLGFGASPLGSVFENIDEAEGVQAVHEALRLGINYFDVSPFYGATKAETVLGRALKDLPRDQFVLSTKVGRYGENVFDFSADRVTRSIDESCQRLNVDYIDIILCHDVEFVPLKQIVEETLPALRKLRDAGKIKFIGVSGLPLKTFKWILDNTSPGDLDVVLSYCHYCLTDDSLLSLVPALKEKGVGIINASPLSMGLLTPQGPPSWHPAPAEMKETCAKAVKHCVDHGADLPRMAVRYSTGNPDITSTLVGMCTLKQLRANFEAVTTPSTEKESAQLHEVQDILASQKNTTWASGLEENN